ncbi:MAG: hypothetical protein A3H59_02510 [Candidatus Jacksonbacteria bacterium RIFCSPLOWO2_02_FULL_43_9]|nr:MAG: hypothetical protein UV70_C0006G0013 [Parcubacteria group bacterium GW2011_GWA2_43_13]OGY69016.1 MAG: hypothetical protein A3B94_00195 [Candidatus Jacksonbacteria bacterium RIFCSPHIGHO2_02_FULL_43_10]OGY70279.1 MAG: hypothetical protein A2986_04415 [Candidatus Jacksonbacteria bacterium RIFCSPLOWO2_01_FULL_44_13]OGY72461.1 MAG: hypothetical protein A3H59_02510 [Candidatus Jacksonbacteria bacterium RIFCSPLOWO2_02_FULL_43_9]HAZ16952.1 hypothetical protein [Candidatus Jacksonbacteria bacter
MERGSRVRIIGNASEEGKEKVRVDIDNAFHHHIEYLPNDLREKFQQNELPKIEQEIALIACVNKATNELLEQCGIDVFDVPVENYHILPADIYKEISLFGHAEHQWIEQSMVFNADHVRKSPVYFGSCVFHETLHIKAHLSLLVQGEGDDLWIYYYRAGVSAGGTFQDELHKHFSGLDEAIIACQQKEFTHRLLSLTVLEEEKDWLLSDEALAKKKRFAEKHDLSEDEIIWVSKSDPDDFEGMGYASQRRVLEYVCKEIQKEFPDRFSVVDDVFKEFLQAHFTGRLLPIARLVEETFGEGSFRLLGNMGVEQDSGVLYLESLQKARGRHIRGRIPGKEKV